jgi:sorbin and SH3 domain-containing protein 1
MDPTKICTGKGAVTLRASSSYREIPSSSPVSPQETPQHESMPGVLPLKLGEDVQSHMGRAGGHGASAQGAMNSLANSFCPNCPWDRWLLVPSVMGSPWTDR